MAQLNKITGIVVGQGGEALQFTIVDNDGNAINISAYTGTCQALLRDPSQIVTKTYTATFVSTGADGQIQFTPVIGDIDRPGDWELQFKLAATSVARYTVPAVVKVEKAIG